MPLSTSLTALNKDVSFRQLSVDQQIFGNYSGSVVRNEALPAAPPPDVRKVSDLPEEAPLDRAAPDRGAKPHRKEGSASRHVRDVPPIRRRSRSGGSGVRLLIMARLPSHHIADY